MPHNSNNNDFVGDLQGIADIGQTLQVVVPAQTAGTAFEVEVYKAPASSKTTQVNRLSITASAAITGAATNFQTLQFRQYRAGALVGTFTGAVTYATTASLAAHTEQVLLSTPVTLRAGDIVTLQSATSGTGAALPMLTAHVEASPSAS